MLALLNADTAAILRPKQSAKSAGLRAQSRSSLFFSIAQTSRVVTFLFRQMLHDGLLVLCSPPLTGTPTDFRSPSVSRMTPSTETPNHALQRTPGFGVQLPSAALVRPAQSRAVLPAMEPGTARAFALRRRAHSPVPGPESLSLGSLGVASRS